MNNQTVLKKTFLVIAGAVCGGAVGYMISEVVVDRILYGPKKSEEKLGEEEEGQLIDYSALEEHVVKKHPYSKPALGELVRELDYAPKESVYIIDYDNEDVEQPCETEDIYYYERDTTFCYESKDMVEDPNGIFVPNVHLHFGEKSEDKDRVAVYNTDLNRIYLIHRLDKSYAIDVLGQEDPEASKEKKEPPKKKATTKQTQRNRRAAKTKKDPVEELTDDPHETDGK